MLANRVRMGVQSGGDEWGDLYNVARKESIWGTGYNMGLSEYLINGNKTGTSTKTNYYVDGSGQAHIEMFFIKDIYVENIDIYGQTNKFSVVLSDVNNNLITLNPTSEDGYGLHSIENINKVVRKIRVNFEGAKAWAIINEIEVWGRISSVWNGLQNIALRKPVTTNAYEESLKHYATDGNLNTQFFGMGSMFVEVDLQGMYKVKNIRVHHGQMSYGNQTGLLSRLEIYYWKNSEWVLYEKTPNDKINSNFGGVYNTGVDNQIIETNKIKIDVSNDVIEYKYIRQIEVYV